MHRMSMELKRWHQYLHTSDIIIHLELSPPPQEEIGGGLYASNGVVGDVNNTQIRENIAPEGAGFFIETSTLDIKKSIFSGNEIYFICNTIHP